MPTKVCVICRGKFFVKPSREEEAKFCSRSCYGISIRGKIPKSAFKKGQHPSPKNEYRPGKDHPYFGKSSPAKGKHWTVSMAGIQKSREKRSGVPKLKIRGDKHWNWQGGITEESVLMRHSLEYKLWRKAIFERDGFRCVLCGCSKSGSLNADHIKPFSLFPELRFAIDNGRTLCISCHRKTNTYGVTLPKKARQL